MIHRQAQAALEYIFTYGWAFLAILITLGVLTYFGVFDFSTLKSPECVFPSGANCEDFFLGDMAGQDQLSVLLLNTFGTDLKIQSGNISDTRTGNFTCDTYDMTGVATENWFRDSMINVSCPVTAGLIPSQYYEWTVKLAFQQLADSSVTYDLVGWVTGSAQ